MAWWITVYCRRSVAHLQPTDVLGGITDRDREAPAGADYLTLAESYGVDEDEVPPALSALAVRARSDEPVDFEVSCDRSSRPIVLHRWHAAARLEEELLEASNTRSIPSELTSRLQQTTEIIAIELGRSELASMAIVFAYELARYFAQKGDGIIVDDDDRWSRIEAGAFVEVAAD